MLKILPIKRFLYLKNKLSKSASKVNILLIVLTLFYISSLFLFDKIHVYLEIESSNCRNYEFKGDVLDIKSLANYSYHTKLNEGRSININFPLRSKVFLMSLCPKEEIIIKKAGIIFRNNKRNVNLFGAVNNCYYCETRYENGELHIKGLTDNSLFEVADYIHLLPLTTRLTHYYLRYFPYLLLISFLIFYLLILPPLKITTVKVLIYSSIILIPILIFFNDIRNTMPPPHINEKAGIGLSQYSGKSILADNILYYVIVFVPYFVYLIFVLFNKNKKLKK